MEPKDVEEGKLLLLEDRRRKDEVDAVKEEEEEEPPLPSLEEVEGILGYKFRNRGLLEEAFMHVSYKEGCTSSYERLEYVGDSVLNMLITREQFFAYPGFSPGALTRLRAANVDTEKLARVAVKLGLHRYLRHKMPLLESQIKEFTEAISEYPLHSNGQIDVPKVLADVVESTIGAVFIDCNASVDTVWEVFKDLLQPAISPKTLKLHPRSELFETCQKKGLRVKFVDLWKEHNSFEVFIDDHFAGRGSYGLKKEIAQNRAAKVALDNMRRILVLAENASVQKPTEDSPDQQNDGVSNSASLEDIEEEEEEEEEEEDDSKNGCDSENRGIEEGHEEDEEGYCNDYVIENHQDREIGCNSDSLEVADNDELDLERGTSVCELVEDSKLRSIMKRALTLSMVIEDDQYDEDVHWEAI